MNTEPASFLPSARSHRGAAGRAGLTAVVAVLGLAASAAAQAQDVASLGPTASLQGRIAPTGRAMAPSPVSFERSRLLEDDRATATATGLDARGRPLNEVGGVTYRWWLGRGATNVGLGVGAIGYMVPSDNATSLQSLSYRSSVLSVGLRYHMDNRTLFADASGARRFSEDTSDRYSTKVGVEWKGRSNKFGLDGASRSVAFQLDSGYRMSLKVRRNGIGVYVKGQF